jgi:hypothetical protein
MAGGIGLATLKGIQSRTLIQMDYVERTTDTTPRTDLVQDSLIPNFHNRLINQAILGKMPLAILTMKGNLCAYGGDAKAIQLATQILMTDADNTVVLQTSRPRRPIQRMLLKGVFVMHLGSDRKVNPTCGIRKTTWIFWAKLASVGGK